MIDVVYPIGRGSRHHNVELRYSLRSMVKHLRGVRNVYVIGDIPEWITGVNAIHFTERWHKQRNIMSKLMQVCMMPEVSEEFMMVHDDHFFLEEADAHTFPYYWGRLLHESMQDLQPGNVYRHTLRNTIHALLSKNHALKNFDIHCPMRFNKKLFTEVMARYDWNERFGFVIKSLYANTAGIDGEQMSDLKIRKSFKREELLSMLQDRKWFSCSDDALNEDLKKIMEELYPDESKYEQ